MNIEKYRFPLFLLILLGFIFLGSFTQLFWTTMKADQIKYAKDIAQLNTELKNTESDLTVLKDWYTYMPTPDRLYGSPIVLNEFRGYTSPFGIRLDPTKDNVGGMSQTNHTGQDMIGERLKLVGNKIKGTPDALVQSIGKGIIKIKYYSKGWHKISGKMKYFKGHDIFDGYVVIVHPNGDESEYGHLGEIYVYENQQVDIGTPLGRISQKLNGKTTGPHVHFALRDKNGKYLSPFRYIKMPKEIL